jgi:hypothetical protein
MLLFRAGEPVGTCIYFARISVFLARFPALPLAGKIKGARSAARAAVRPLFLYAAGHFYFRCQDAVVALIEATPEDYRLKASFEMPFHLDNS